MPDNHFNVTNPHLYKQNPPGTAATEVAILVRPVNELYADDQVYCLATNHITGNNSRLVEIKVLLLILLVIYASRLLLSFAGEPENFLNFIWRAATRSEPYGSGEIGWDISKSIDNIFRIAKSDPLFIALLIFQISILVKYYVTAGPKRWTSLKENITFISILGISCAALGQWFVVVKQFRQYYLLPGTLILVLGLYILWNRWYTSFKTKKTAIVTTIGSVIVLLVFQTPLIYSWASWRIGYRNACQNIEKYIHDNFPNSPVASAKSSATMSLALSTFKRFYSQPLILSTAIDRIYPLETSVNFHNDLILRDKLASPFDARPALVVVKRNTNPSKLRGLDLAFKGKYYQIYLLNKQPK